MNGKRIIVTFMMFFIGLVVIIYFGNYMNSLTYTGLSPIDKVYIYPAVGIGSLLLLLYLTIK